MSEEIRALIDRLVHLSELLLATPLDDQQREYAASVGASARKLLSVIDATPAADPASRVTRVAELDMDRGGAPATAKPACPPAPPTGAGASAASAGGAKTAVHGDPGSAGVGELRIDEVVIETLIRDLTPALMPEVLDTFVAEVTARIDAIECAVADGDWARAGGEGHSLKGSAATFGAVALRDLARAIEDAGRAGDGATLRALVAPLGTCGTQTLQVLCARIGADGA
jgi:HPt (histidine-containing phosphotransfer) domain-containing protein